MNLLYVAVGGALGSVARFLMTHWMGRVWVGEFPYAILSVNVLGSFLMGALVEMLARLMPPQTMELRLFLGVGLLGGFTTFSAFSLDAVTMIERGETPAMLAYVAASVVLSVLALFAGLWVMRAALP